MSFQQSYHVRGEWFKSGLSSTVCIEVLLKIFDPKKKKKKKKKKNRHTKREIPEKIHPAHPQAEFG